MESFRVGVALLAVVFLFVAARAGDIIFTMDDGVEYTLHEGGNWSCGEPGCENGVREDFVVGLNDGRSIVIQRNREWHYKEKGELVGTVDILINRAKAKSVGTSMNVDQAATKARKSVVNKIALKIKNGARKRQLFIENILFCMDKRRVVPETRQTFDKKAGWTVTAEISLERHEIIGIIECAEEIAQQPEEKPAEKPSTGPESQAQPPEKQ